MTMNRVGALLLKSHRNRWEWRLYQLVKKRKLNEPERQKVYGWFGDEFSLLIFNIIIVSYPTDTELLSVFSARKSGAEVFKNLSLCGVGYSPLDLLPIRQ